MARDHPRLGARHVQFEQGGEEVAGIDVAFQRALVDRHGFGIGAPAIDHAGNQSLQASAISGALAGLVARFGAQLLDVTHVKGPSVRQVFWRGRAGLLAEGNASRNWAGKISRLIASDRYYLNITDA